MTQRIDTYYICNGCGHDSRDDREHIAASPGNAFVILAAVNTETGAELIREDTHICSQCWCRVQEIALGFSTSKQEAVDRQHRLENLQHEAEGIGPWA